MLKNQEEGKNSQFLEGCNTDWNLNHEFICWLGHWCKVYREETKGIIDLTFHRYKYRGKNLSQAEIIDRIIELCDKIDKKYYDWDKTEELEKEVNEVFALFHLVYWAMWW